MKKMPSKVTKAFWKHSAITTDHLHISDVLFQPYFYEQGLVKILSKCGDEVLQSTLGSVGEYHKVAGGFEETDYCIKVEGIEKMSPKVWQLLNCAVNPHGNDKTPLSCHMFVSKAGSPSFPEHTDPDGVMLYVIAGKKTIAAGGKTYEISPGETLWIPAGTKHQAFNHHSSIMLSIGFDRFHIEKFECTETSTSKRRKAANLTVVTALLAVAAPLGRF